VLAVGCAPAVLLENPAEWPSQWADRQLYHTPEVFIYATDERLAGEADRLVRDTIKDFEKRAGRRPAKGLIVVTDVRDAPLVKEARRWFELAERSKAIWENKPTPKPEEPDEAWASFVEAAAELGVEATIMLQLVPFHLAREQFAGVLDFPDGVPEEAQWAVVMPSRALVRKCNKAVIRGALNEAGIGPVAQVLLAPVLVPAEEMALSAAAATRNVALFATFAHRHEESSDEEAGDQIKGYADHKIEQAMGPMAGLVKSAGREGQSTVTTQASDAG
jgi:hypothetical protein